LRWAVAAVVVVGVLFGCAKKSGQEVVPEMVDTFSETLDTIHPRNETKKRYDTAKQMCFEESSTILLPSIIRAWKCSNTTVTLTKDGTLLVKGVGAMEDYDYRWDCGEFCGMYNSNIVYAPWLDFCELITKLIIEDGVTHIGKYTFTGLHNLKSVTIPASVTSIGVAAFKNCEKLISVTIPDSVTSIDGMMFEGCTGLTSVIIGNSVTSIEDAAFLYCKNLVSITIPNNVTYIGNAAFARTGLTSVIIPNGNIHIDDEAFACCYGLKSITFPQNMIRLGKKVFDNCKNLESVTIMSSNPPEIDSDVFKSVNLNNVCLYIPATGFFAYRAARPWNDFGRVILMGVTRLVLSCILTLLILLAAVFVVIRRLRKSSRNVGGRNQ